MHNRLKIRDLFYLLGLWLINAAAFFTLSPARHLVPHRDSGIFLYIGSQLLQGKILYLQTWDNKQPLLYALNALGLWIGHGSIWGVLALEMVLFMIVLGLLYIILRRKLSPFQSFLLTGSVFLCVYQIMSSNFSEEYTIFFQALLLGILFLAYLPKQQNRSARIAAWCLGAVTALAFALKQTYIDLGIGVFLLILFLAWLNRSKQGWLDALRFAGGFLLVNALIFGYFLLHRALSDYIISAFLINKYYSSQALLEWLNSLAKAVEFITQYPLFFLAVALWLGAFALVLYHAWFRLKEVWQRFIAAKWIVLAAGLILLGAFVYSLVRKPGNTLGPVQLGVLILGLALAALAFYGLFHKYSPAHAAMLPALRSQLSAFNWSGLDTPALLFLGLVSLPVVILAISLSGMNFPHYYISLFTPTFLLLSAAMVQLDQIDRPTPRRAAVFFMAACLCFGSLLPIFQIKTMLLSPLGKGDKLATTASYLKAATTPQQKILVWGWDAGVYFMADREAPTRYSFQFPLYLDTPYQAQAQKTLLQDIQADPPAYIADTQNDEMPFLKGLTTQQCLAENPAGGTPLQAIRNYVCSNYVPDKSFSGIQIYRHQ